MERHGADKRNARALASLRTRENAKYDGKEARKGARNREMIIRYYASPPCKFHAHLSFPLFRYTILLVRGTRFVSDNIYPLVKLLPRSNHPSESKTRRDKNERRKNRWRDKGVVRFVS